MKNNENNRSLLRRYLDGLYTTDDARRLLDELQAPEYNTDMLQELMDEVWEEASLQSPQTDKILLTDSPTSRNGWKRSPFVTNTKLGRAFMTKRKCSKIFISEIITQTAEESN